MPKRARGLTALQVKSVKPGSYSDGAGLLLLVQQTGAASWVLRYSLRGRRRDLGLGSARGYEAIPLAVARELAAKVRADVRAGVDPIEARQTTRAAAHAAKAEPQETNTFGKVVEDYLAAHEPAWRNAKHRGQWRMTLTRYAGPVLRDMAVDAIGTADVLGVLKPLWLSTPETATRLRGRIESVLDFATVNGWRDGPNPARWRGHLAKLLPARGKVRAVKHHAAMPWQEIPEFLVDLRSRNSTSARALEFTILSAARSGEVLGMAWAEIDLDRGIWTVPAQRMKAGREHRVSLSQPAIALLQQMTTSRVNGSSTTLVFSGTEAGRPLSVMAMAMVLRRLQRTNVTVHGMRSCFRDWAGETTAHPREVVEAALAHRTGDKVEQAYARSDLLTRRRKLMDDWGAFCDGLNSGTLHELGPRQLTV